MGLRVWMAAMAARRYRATWVFLNDRLLLIAGHDFRPLKLYAFQVYNRVWVFGW